MSTLLIGLLLNLISLEVQRTSNTPNDSSHGEEGCAKTVPKEAKQTKPVIGKSNAPYPYVIQFCAHDVKF